MKLTNTTVISDRVLEMDNIISESIINNNNLLQGYFNNIRFLSDILPTYLNQLTVLSDQLSDALVISGRTKLGLLARELPILTTENIHFDKSTNTVTLDKTDELIYQINSRQTSIISPSNNYIIYNYKTNTVGFLDSIFRNQEEILIRTKDRTSKYTLSLSLNDDVVINTINLQLGLETESYPLISEIYYINENNQKVNCFIFNTSSNIFDMNINRVSNNNYTLHINPIKTNRLFITLEDVNKSDLIIKTLQIKKTKYQTKGSITFGPLVSSNPILKVAIESSTSEGVRYYISYNNENYVEILKPNDLDLITNTQKIIRYNTVNENSISVADDVYNLYLKVDLESIPVSDFDSTFINVQRNYFTNSFTNINPAISVNKYSVHSDKELLSYGMKKQYTSYPVYKLHNKNVTNIIESNNIKLKGFIDSEYSYTDKNIEILNNISVQSLPLKTGDININCEFLDPYSVSLYGYNIVEHNKKEFSTEDKNIVIKLKNEFNKGIYKIRQNNKEILIDLSLGYINSVTDVLFIVEESRVELLNELGKSLKELEVHSFNDLKYVTLLLDMFEIPVHESKHFNFLYPLELNTENAFSIQDNQFINSIRLIELDNIYTINKEIISTSIELSKENIDYLKVTDNITLDKYTNDNETIIPAWFSERFIKLSDKNIKKGSVKLFKKTDPYLIEVNFINGIEEFKTFTYKSENHLVTIENDFTYEYELILEHSPRDLENVILNIKDKFEISLDIKNISNTTGNKVIVYSNQPILKNDIIEITYLFENLQPSNFYSIDYENGIIYLSNITNTEITINYKYYSTFIVGTHALQLNTEEYSINGNTVELKEAEDNVNYILLYEYNTQLDIPTITPIVTNLKVNYINNIDEDSLP